MLDLSKIQEDWTKTDGPSHLFNIADHYGIFKDLFDHGIFTPCVPLKVSYDYDEQTVSPVYMGNILEACDVSKTSTVINYIYSYTSKHIYNLFLTL